MDSSNIVESSQNAVDDVINIEDSNSITLYGADVQKQIADLSHRVLQCIESAEVDEITSAIKQAMGSLRAVGEDTVKKKVFWGKKAKERLKENNRSEAIKRVEAMEAALDKHRIKLLMDSALYDQMYKMNQTYNQTLESKIDGVRSMLAELKNRPKDGESYEAGWLENTIIHIEHRVEELELAKLVSMQQAAQIQILQKNVASMANGLQSTLYNVIPLWKNQVTIDTSNEQATKTADADIQATNKMLMESLDQIAKIQVETKNKNQEAGIKFVKMDSEMQVTVLPSPDH